MCIISKLHLNVTVHMLITYTSIELAQSDCLRTTAEENDRSIQNLDYVFPLLMPSFFLLKHSCLKL